MTRTQTPAGTGSIWSHNAWLSTTGIAFLFVIVAMATGAFAQEPTGGAPTASDAQYISLTPAEFAEKAADLIKAQQ